MKKLLTYCLFFSGLFGFSSAKAAQYTHILNYTNTDNAGTALLTARVTFEDTSPFASQDTTDSRGEDIQTGFTTLVTYTYTPVPNGPSYTINTSDIRYYTFIRNGGSVDFTGATNLKDQLTNLQFSNANGTGSFALSINEFDNIGGGNAFSLQALIPGGVENDFDLVSTEFPAPLPILGIIPAFTSIRKLKKRYNLKVNK